MGELYFNGIHLGKVTDFKAKIKYEGGRIMATTDSPDILLYSNNKEGGMMTLEEAIKHAKEVSKKASCCNCKEEHIQLAEWLTRLKKLEDVEKDLKECIQCLKEAVEHGEVDTVWLQEIEKKYNIKGA